MSTAKTIGDLLALVRTSVEVAGAPATVPTRLVELLGELEALAGDLGLLGAPSAEQTTPLTYHDVEHIRAQERAALEASRAAACSVKP